MNWRLADDALSLLSTRILAACGPAAQGAHIEFGELTVMVEASSIVDVLRILRDHPGLRFQQLVDICGADYPQRDRRFDVVYHLLVLLTAADIPLDAVAQELERREGRSGLEEKAARSS